MRRHFLKNTVYFYIMFEYVVELVFGRLVCIRYCTPSEHIPPVSVPKGNEAYGRAVITKFEKACSGCLLYAKTKDDAAILRSRDHNFVGSWRGGDPYQGCNFE